MTDEAVGRTGEITTSRDRGRQRLDIGRLLLAAIAKLDEKAIHDKSGSFDFTKFLEEALKECPAWLKGLSTVLRGR